MQSCQDSGHNEQARGSATGSGPTCVNGTSRDVPRLIVFSAFDSPGIQRQLSVHREALINLGDDLLDDYAYALACRRDAHAWKAFCVLSSSADLSEKPLVLSAKAHRAAREHPTLCWIFTGQGAQWHGMGKELLACSVFRDSLLKSQRQLEQLGWTSSLIEMLTDSNLAPLLNKAQYSQVCTTCLQIALVDVCGWLCIMPSVVVGHSSGGK
jgi:acyl transferase domain-containing protein